MCSSAMSHVIEIEKPCQIVFCVLMSVGRELLVVVNMVVHALLF